MTSLTERALAASLGKLLQKRTLDKITVRDITDDCGVNRQTFYYHFHDVYELLERFFSLMAEDFLSEYGNTENWKENIWMLMKKLHSNQALILNAFRSVDRNQSGKFLQELARPAIAGLASEFSKDMEIKKEDFDFVVDIFTFAFAGILTEWIAEGMNTEYQKDIDRFFLVIDGTTMRSALGKFAK